MDKPQCENCGKPFLPTWTGRPSRFCCRACSGDAWFAEERRQAVVFFRQQGMKVRTTQASEPEEERRAAQA
jgi:hypothetical protein